MSLLVLGKMTSQACTRNVICRRVLSHAFGTTSWARRRAMYSQMHKLLTSQNVRAAVFVSEQSVWKTGHRPMSSNVTVPAGTPMLTKQHSSQTVEDHSYCQRNSVTDAVQLDKYFLHPKTSVTLSLFSRGFQTTGSQSKKKKHARKRDSESDEVEGGGGRERDAAIERDDLIEDIVDKDLAEEFSLEEKSAAGRETTLKALVRMILDKAVSQGAKVDSFVPEQVESQVEHLLQRGFTPSLTLFLLSRRPELVTSQRWQALLDAMLLHGLTPRRVTHMMVNTDNLTKVSVRQFSAMVECLRGVGLTDSQLLLLLSQSPEVLRVSPKTVVSRMNALRELFKTKDVLRLLSSCPRLLFEDMADIQEKFDYVFYVMGVSQRQMMHSRLFTYDLAHVQTRHAFVERAGFFSSQRRREGEKNMNPRLDHVIDTTDKSFTRRFGNMSPEDYAAFKVLFAMELEMRAEDDGDEDSEDD